MGCTASVSERNKKKIISIPEVVIFIPAMRVPVDLDLHHIALNGIVPPNLLHKFSSLRSQITLIAENTGGSALHELQRALDEYLPVLLGLTNRESGLEELLVEFKWRNLLDEQQECCLTSPQFELFFVLHMMAILSLWEANSLLVLMGSSNGSEKNADKDRKKNAIGLFMKATGYLDFCVRSILAPLPQKMKSKLPGDMQESVLQAISIQALGQVTELQLGLAIKSRKATSSVKRRLACERLTYFAQVRFSLSRCDITYEYRKKHLSFIKWKYLESKAAAYYLHGLILDKGKEPSGEAVRCFLAADKLLTDSKKSCLSFCLAKPVTRAPQVWGVMKHLHDLIPDIASKKSQMYGYLLGEEKALAFPELPEFQLSLRSEDYRLPEIDAAWVGEKKENEVGFFKEHLLDGEAEPSTPIEWY